MNKTNATFRDWANRLESTMVGEDEDEWDIDFEAYRTYYDQGMTPLEAIEAMEQERRNAGVTGPGVEP